MTTITVLDEVESGEHNLSTGQGETFTLNLTVNNPSLNLTGYAIKLKVTTIYDKRQTYSGTVVGNNGARVVVTDEDTAKWPIGKHDYRVDIISNGGEDRRLIFGQLEVVG